MWHTARGFWRRPLPGCDEFPGVVEAPERMAEESVCRWTLRLAACVGQLKIGQSGALYGAVRCTGLAIGTAWPSLTAAWKPATLHSASTKGSLDSTIQSHMSEALAMVKQRRVDGQSWPAPSRPNQIGVGNDSSSGSKTVVVRIVAWSAAGPLAPQLSSFNLTQAMTQPASLLSLCSLLSQPQCWPAVPTRHRRDRWCALLAGPACRAAPSWKGICVLSLCTNTPALPACAGSG